ncbi:putative mitochondrial ornithine carrier protein AmcA/Ort1 [Globomyces pollinis-pini]|nr:putative mitochondrial ornithine carrier protein AmcA/Ort1 [Globomyces pollinis-pini]
MESGLTTEAPRFSKLQEKQFNSKKLDKDESALIVKNDSTLADLIFGSVSGFTGKIVEYPFDTVKVHLQTHEKQTIPQCIRNILKTEGVRGFFTGISAPLVGSMAENAVLFLAYAQIQRGIRYFNGTKDTQPLSLGQLCLAGGLSGAVVSFVLTPVELLKCRLQMQSYLTGINDTGRHQGTISMFVHTLKTKGISGLYKGHTGTFLREVAGGVAWFGVYELMVDRLIKGSKTAKSKDDLSPLQLMFAGALAGMSYNAALFPADVIKTRVQSGLHEHDGFITATKDIYRTQGIRGFFRGFGITVARSAPSSGIIFLTYEWMSRHVKL